MKITNFRTIDKPGSLVAAFDVEFAPLTVRGIRLIRKGDGGMFISEPSDSYQKDGETKFSKHVVITDEQIRARIETAAKEIWHSKQGHSPEPAFAADDDGAPFV